MERIKPYTPFKLFRRKRKKGKPIYYVAFRNPDNTWATYKSTGETSRVKAEMVAWEYLQKMENENVKYFNQPTFAEFSKDFFAWEGDWAKEKRITGKRISETRCIEYGKILENHILPVLGDLKLSQITRQHLKQLRDKIYEMRSGAMVNRSLMIVNFILRDAEDKQYIHTAPKIERVSQIPVKQKGIVTIEEARNIFTVKWRDFRGFVFSLAAVSTGARMGELLGLRVKNFKDNYLEIEQSWNSHAMKLNPTTKTGRPRHVIIPDNVSLNFMRLINLNPYKNLGGDAFIFFSLATTEHPADGKFLSKCLFDAMEKAGITEAERKLRNITFHSWRYFLNSLLINAKIPLQKVQSMTGHVTNEMSLHYYAPDVENMQDIQETQNLIFDPEEP